MKEVIQARSTTGINGTEAVLKTNRGGTESGGIRNSEIGIGGSNRMQKKCGDEERKRIGKENWTISTISNNNRMLKIEGKERKRIGNASWTISTGSNSSTTNSTTSSARTTNSIRCCSHC